jgi:hypothetical protein
MQIVDANVGTMEGELKRWAAKLGELRSRGHTVGGELNLDYHQRLDEMEAKYDAAETKLDELKTAGSARWETFRSGIESAWGELEDAFRKLTN